LNEGSGEAGRNTGLRRGVIESATLEAFEIPEMPEMADTGDGDGR
jgi:hypothetical protein